MAHDAAALYSESSGRFLVEVAEEDAPAFEAELEGLVWACIGHTGGDALQIAGLDGQAILAAPLRELKAAWQGERVVPV